MGFTLYTRARFFSYLKNDCMKPPFVSYLGRRSHRLSTRQISSSTRLYRQQSESKEPFGERLRKALRETKIQWYPIPVGLGIGFLGLIQFYRTNEREEARDREDGRGEGKGLGGRPKKRRRIRPDGPWYALEKLSYLALLSIEGRFRLCQRSH
jgi:phosphatidylserine decarboxylase